MKLTIIVKSENKIVQQIKYNDWLFPIPRKGDTMVKLRSYEDHEVIVSHVHWIGDPDNDFEIELTVHSLISNFVRESLNW